jgi:hypothetical protein
MGIPEKRPRRIGRREAERLLDGGSITGPVDTGRMELSRVLDALAGPALPEEVAGEQAAAALFGRQYELGRRTPASSPSWQVRRAPRPRLAVRMAVALGVLLCAGLATSAETGLLPAALQRPAHALFSPLGVPAPPSPGASQRSKSPSHAPGIAPTASPRGSTLPSPYPTAAPGWCEKYAQGKTNGKELRDLTAAAGGTQKIAAYCAAVRAAAATPPPGPSTDTKPGKSPKVKPSKK